MDESDGLDAVDDKRPGRLRTMVELMGADHILYAEDYPYEQSSDFHNFLMRSSLTDEQKQLIAHKNAERLYHLKET